MLPGYQISDMFRGLETLEIAIYSVNDGDYLPMRCSVLCIGSNSLCLCRVEFVGKALEGNLPELRVLGFMDCSITDDHSFVSSMKNFENLTLSSSQTFPVNPEFLPVLAHSTDLRSLFLPLMFLDEILPSLTE